jgi:hypothetical protein
MPSKTVELTWVMISAEFPDANFGAWSYARCLGVPVTEVILLAAALPSDLPTSFVVTYSCIELDKWEPGSGGNGQIKQLFRGMSKTKSTWNLLNKDTGKTWRSGGPFNISIDLGELFWSGAFNNNDPQVCVGNAALADYIEGRGESGWVQFGVYPTTLDVKTIDGARLKFDYTPAGDPAVTGFSPGSMNFGQTPAMTITGVSFQSAAFVSAQLVGAATHNLTSPVVVSDTQITGNVPAGVAVGDYTVRVNLSGKPPADSAAKFVVNSVGPVVTSVEGDTGAGFVKHFKRWVYLNGSSLTAPLTSITLLGQEGQGEFALTSVQTVVAGTKIKGWLAGPIPPGRYQLTVTCTAGTVARQIDVTLGPAWW